jgi:hypothetical protein
MNIENILDESFNESPPQNKWKLALLSILILTIGYAITMLFQNQILVTISSYASKILALYFFIKRINYEDIDIGKLFWWSTFIIFGGYLIVNVFHLLFISDQIIDSLLTFIFFNLGALFRSIIFGNMLSIGVFHLIKNDRYSTLISMILTSWIFQTMLIDLAQFEG